MRTKIDFRCKVAGLLLTLALTLSGLVAGRGVLTVQASSSALEAGAYKITANLSMPGQYNPVISGLTVYANNPNNPFGPTIDENDPAEVEKAIPQTPLSYNATLIVRSNGDKYLYLPVKNPIFTTQDLGTCSKLPNVSTERVYPTKGKGSGLYEGNYNKRTDRIHKILAKLTDTKTSGTVTYDFSGSVLYAVPLDRELKPEGAVSLQLTVNYSQIKKISSATALPSLSSKTVKGTGADWEPKSETQPQTEQPQTETEQPQSETQKQPQTETNKTPQTEKPANNNTNTATSTRPALSSVQKKILAAANEKDISGAAFSVLQARVKKVTNSYVTLTWSKVKGAKKYIVYANACGKKYKKAGTVTGTSYTQKKLKKGTFYKYVVVAVDSSNKVAATSATVHVVTGGGKYTNISKVAISSKTSLSLKKGKTSAVKVKTTLANKKLKTKSHRALKYESSNKAIATVTAKGVIKAVKKGTCYIYAYAQNGMYARVKVTVK